MNTLPAGGLRAKTFSAAGAGVPTAVVHGGVLAYAKTHQAEHQAVVVPLVW